MTAPTRRFRTLLSPEARRDEGVALLSVIGLMAVLGIMVIAIAGATMFTVGQTTSTRASVQAKAAAEAGIDQVRAMIADPSWTCPTSAKVTGTGDTPYVVQIRVSTTSTADARSTPGCPSSSTRSIFLESTGTAAAKGVGRGGGDTRVMNALISKPMDAPRFNHALYGKNSIEINSPLGVVSSDNTGDVFTSGDIACRAGATIDGSLLVGRTVTFNSNGCKVKGDVYAGADFICEAGTRIDGNVYVKGNAYLYNNGCTIMGDLWVDGDVAMNSAGTRLGRNLLARGNLTASGLPSAQTETITLGGGVNVGGDAWWAGQVRNAYQARLVEGARVEPAPVIPSHLFSAFPELRVDDPMFAGWRQGNWRDALQAAGPGAPWMMDDPCSMSGKSFNGSLNVTSNTVFNTLAACPSGMSFGGNLTIRLDADMVVFAKQFKQQGKVTILPGASGVKRSLYVITPWGGECSSEFAPIYFEHGEWVQDPRVSVLLYSNGEISINNTPSIYGQMYGCKITTHPGAQLTYNPVGSVVDPALAPWSLSYVKDR